MHVLLALGLMLSAAPLEATEPVDPPAAEEQKEEVVAPEPPIRAVVPAVARVQRTEIVDRPAEAAEFPPRGSFWWYVGVIVVAGVILAVLL